MENLTKSQHGEIRQARGTLNMGTIPATKHPKTDKPLNPKVFTYYDIDKDDWRCFKIETFLGVA